jgi:hypothetical protein
MLKEWEKINLQNLELKCIGIGSLSEVGFLKHLNNQNF